MTYETAINVACVASLAIAVACCFIFGAPPTPPFFDEDGIEGHFGAPPESEQEQPDPYLAIKALTAAQAAKEVQWMANITQCLNELRTQLGLLRAAPPTAAILRDRELIENGIMDAERCLKYLRARAEGASPEVVSKACAAFLKGRTL